ncbi:MAG TPA: molecular chaperone DnaJ [bacterium]|nr:molecular chaperone DnaJ [bacterium]
MSKDYYSILGVPKTATEEEIKKAFRKEAHKHHPDKSGGDEAKFKELNEAYQVLSNKDRRARYDQFGSSFESGQAGGGQQTHWGGFGDGQGFNINMDDLGDLFGGFGDMFGFGGNRQKSQRQSRGSDIEVRMEIEFKDAVFGAEKLVRLAKTITCNQCQGNGAEPGSKIETCPTCNGRGSVAQIQRTIFGQMQVQTTCPTCQGDGKKITKPCHTCSGSGVIKDNTELKIKIPAGIDNGESIRLTGQGEAGEKGASPGDLYVHVIVIPDKRFKRMGTTVFSQAHITFPQAALGTSIDITTVDGEVSLKIPSGTQSGKIFMLKDRGIPSLRGKGRGDHQVEVIVDTPAHLSRKQKQLLEEFDVN